MSAVPSSRNLLLAGPFVASNFSISSRSYTAFRKSTCCRSSPALPGGCSNSAECLARAARERRVLMLHLAHGFSGPTRRARRDRLTDEHDGGHGGEAEIEPSAD